jgi:hypothetical protein
MIRLLRSAESRVFNKSENAEDFSLAGRQPGSDAAPFAIVRIPQRESRIHSAPNRRYSCALQRGEG